MLYALLVQIERFIAEQIIGVELKKYIYWLSKSIGSARASQRHMGLREPMRLLTIRLNILIC